MQKKVIEYKYFFGIRFNSLDKKDLIDYAHLTDGFQTISTVNSQFIVSANDSTSFLSVLNSSICTVDGQIPYFLIKNTFKSVNKISGSDLIYYLIDFCKIHNLKVYILGGDSHVNTQSVQILRNRYGVVTNGSSEIIDNKNLSLSSYKNLKLTISDFKPDVILVALGAVKQECWLHTNRQFLDDIGVSFGIGLGGTFDFLTEKYKRAPKFIQYTGLEGLYRLLQQPSLFRLKRLIESFKIFFIRK